MSKFDFAELPPEEEEARREVLAALSAKKNAEQEHRRQQLTADQRKESILSQLKQGGAPQYILYTAIEAIAGLTNDEEWAQECVACLDRLYTDLAQQSLLADNEALAAARVEQMRATYNAKLRRNLERQLDGYDNIARGLREALAALDDMEE